jgi:hypothetical protein
VVDAVCYKQEGRGFETRWCDELFSVYLILPAGLGPGVYSAYNRNEYQRPVSKADRHLWADCLYKTWDPQHLTTLGASTACYGDSFTFYFFYFLLQLRKGLRSLESFLMLHEMFAFLYKNWMTVPIPVTFSVAPCSCNVVNPEMQLFFLKIKLDGFHTIRFHKLS